MRDSMFDFEAGSFAYSSDDGTSLSFFYEPLCLGVAVSGAGVVCVGGDLLPVSFHDFSQTLSGALQNIDRDLSQVADTPVNTTKFAEKITGPGGKRLAEYQKEVVELANECGIDAGWIIVAKRRMPDIKDNEELKRFASYLAVNNFMRTAYEVERAVARSVIGKLSNWPLTLHVVHTQSIKTGKRLLVTAVIPCDEWGKKGYMHILNNGIHYQVVVPMLQTLGIPRPSAVYTALENLIKAARHIGVEPIDREEKENEE